MFSTQGKSTFAKFIQNAFPAQRFPGIADFSPMVYQKKCKNIPIILWDDLHKIFFNFFRIRVSSQSQPESNPFHMCINGYPIYFPNAPDNTIFAVFRATPGSVSRASIVSGTFESNSLTRSLDNFLIFFALFL